MKRRAFVCKQPFGSAAWILVLACHVAITEAQDQTVGPNFVVPSGISFSSLPGPNFSAYTGHTEGDFTITPTAGTWLQSIGYGNPVPSILDGPVNAPGIAVLLITDNVGLFNFTSLDFSSNNGNSSYDIQGYLGPTLKYHETGTLAASFSPFSFKTLLSTDPLLQVDALLVEVIPGSGVTSINLDNIQVATVPIPEPNALIVLAAGLLVFIGCRRRALADRS